MDCTCVPLIGLIIPTVKYYNNYTLSIIKMINKVYKIIRIII